VKRITIADLKRKKERREKIVMVTAYDYPFAKIVDEAGVDVILVGDSLSMVVLGYDSTHRIGMREILHHLRAVVNAKPRALVVADMPFGSYEISPEQALKNAIKLIKAGADAVKVEGGKEIVETIKKLVKAGIPVMAHVGLNPQRYLTLGGYKLIGKSAKSARKVIEDAIAVANAGAFAVVIEHTAAEVAKIITERIDVPTICIGSGPWCDGQVLVLHDILGLSDSIPYFAKVYANVREVALNAVKQYVREVREGLFPREGMYKRMSSDEVKRLEEEMRSQ